MNVDCNNFGKLLKQILADLGRCDFIAFDGEFSGLKTIPFASEDEFQSEEEFYQRMKDTCINFSLLQLGLCMFRWQEGQYVPTCYNFYLKNNTANGRKANNLMLSQVDCLEFLSKNKMDWKRLFHHGITSTRLSEKANIERKCREGIQEPPKEYVFLQMQDQLAVQEIMTKIAEFKKSDRKDMIIDFGNKSVFHEVKRKANVQLDKDANLKLKDYEYVLRQTKNQPKGGKPKYKEAEKPTQSKNDEFPKTAVEDQEKKQAEEVQQTKQPAPKKDKKDKSSSEQSPQVSLRIQQEMGLSLVVEEMIRLKKPLVGHFASLDLGFLYQTFIGELPPTFEQFCLSLRQMFPHILDTKVISKKIQHHIKGLRVDLSSLFEACHDSKLLKPYTNVDLSTYEGAECEHEAGYDAYITGSCFVAMLNYLHHHEAHVKEEVPKKKPPKKQPETKALAHSRIQFEGCPFDGIIYSKFSAEVKLDGKQSNKFDNRVIIIEGNIETAALELSKYGSLRVCVKELIYAKYDQQQDTRSIIERTNSQHFRLIHYRDRRQFKARKYLE